MKMFSKLRISRSIIVLGLLLVVIGIGLMAHNKFLHDAKDPRISFTSDPEIFCDIDGWIFEREIRVNSNGKILSVVTTPKLRDPKFTIRAKSHGLGWAHIILHGKTDGVAFGDKKNSTDQQLGWWVGNVPIGGGLDNTIQDKEYGSFDIKDMPKTYKKTYKWKAKGSVELVPYYWKEGLRGFLPTGSWEYADEDFHKNISAEANGSWQLIQTTVTVPEYIYNKTLFKVGETLRVTVKQPGLYSASLYIDDVFVVRSKANGSGSVVLSKTFGNDNVGNHTIKVELSYYNSKGKFRDYFPHHESTITVSD